MACKLPILVLNNCPSHKEPKPQARNTWVEVGLEKEERKTIFTPPRLRVFQPIELNWADLKEDK